MQPFEHLEIEFSKWIRLANPVACSSGSAALALALQSFNFPPGSEVLVPEFTMIACARAVTLSGLTPIFVDCQENMLIDPEKIRSSITDRTRAIMSVFIYGRQPDKKIYSIADEFELLIIEDRAEYHIPQLSLDPRPAACCFSFYRNKVIAGEEGGMVLFLDDDTAKLAKQLRCMGFTDDHDFLHVPGGFNWRMSNAHAELIRSSLSVADRLLEQRHEIELWYNQFIPTHWRLPLRESPWVYDLRIPNMTFGRQGEIIRDLNSKGIAARHAFKPMSMQPEYLGDYRKLEAFKLSQEVIYLPIIPDMSILEVESIANTLIDFVDQ